MAKIKKISELEQLSSLSDSANILIEEKGQAKRIAASKLVVSGGGEGGASVQPDWNQNNPDAPDYVKNRTHWEENNQTVIRVASDTVMDTVDMEGQPYFYRVADATPTGDDLTGKVLEVHQSGEIVESITVTEDMIAAGQEMTTESFMWVPIVDFNLYIVSKENTVINGVTFSQKGTYVIKDHADAVFAEGFSYTITYGSNTVHQIDPKFLPEGGFGWEESNQTVIEWDGSTEGRDCVTDESGTLEAEGISFYKVSDLILTKDDVIGGTMCIEDQSIPTELIVSESSVTEEDGLLSISQALMVFSNTTGVYSGFTLEVPSTGCYAMSINQGEMRFASLTCGSNTIHKLDPKFLPDGGFGYEGVGKNVIEWDCNPTEEMQANSFQIYGQSSTTITKLSDLTPTKEDLIGGTFSVNNQSANITEEFYEQMFTEHDNHIALSNSMYIFYDTNYSMGGNQFTAPSTGVYVNVKGTTPVTISYGSVPVVHKIDEKFIPDTIARKSDIVPGGYGGVSSWNDLLDKPSSLPNPKSLTFTGAVNASYDGSEEVAVEIPVVEVPVTSVNGMTGDVTIDIPKIPVTSVNGQTGNVVIEVGSGGSGVTSWNDLEDKPFYEEITKSETLYDAQELAFNTQDPSLGNYYMTVVEVSDFDKSFVDGNTYIVSWDGKDYTCVVSAIDVGPEILIMLGNIGIASSAYADTGEPFCVQIRNTSLTVATKETDSSHLFGIYEDSTTVHKLDEKFIPDTIARVSDIPTKMSQLEQDIEISGGGVQPDWNQNDPEQPDYVKNRTHWIEPRTVTLFKSAIEMEPRSDITEGTLINVAENPISLELTEGKTYTVVWNGGVYSCVCQKQDYYTGAGYGYYWYLGNLDFVGNAGDLVNNGAEMPFLIRRDECYTYATKQWTTTSTVFTNGNEATVANVMIGGEGAAYHALDEGFIPDTIARVEDINAPKTEFVLSSPNGTNFRITIDDSGKLVVSNMDGDVIEQSSGSLPDSEEAEF